MLLMRGRPEVPCVGAPWIGRGAGRARCATRALRFFTFAPSLAESLQLNVPPFARVVKGPLGILAGLEEPLGMGLWVMILISKVLVAPLVLGTMVQDPACLGVTQGAPAHQGHERFQGLGVQLEVLNQELLVVLKVLINCEGHPRRGITNIIRYLAPAVPPGLEELRVHEASCMLVKVMQPMLHVHISIHVRTMRCRRRRDFSQGPQSGHTDLLVPYTVALHGH